MSKSPATPTYAHAPLLAKQGDALFDAPVTYGAWCKLGLVTCGRVQHVTRRIERVE